MELAKTKGGSSVASSHQKQKKMEPMPLVLANCPTETFTIIEPCRPLNEISDKQKARLTPDFVALKL